MVLKKFSCVVVVAVVSLVLLSGCPAPSGEPGAAPPLGSKKAVVLARQFSAGDTATYVVTTENSRGITYEGAISEEADFQDSVSSTKVDVTFTEQIESVDANGIAALKITIDKAMYVRESAGRGVGVDYDSSKRGDPLARLAGKSYRIEMDSSGQVTRVLDSKSARSAAGSNAVALGLLKTDTIKRRHSISSLPPAGKNLLRVEDNWSNVKQHDFGLMGKRTYERIYVLLEVTKIDGRRIAMVEMNAIPTTKSPDGETPSDISNPFAEIGDNTDEYTGLLKLDLATGSVDEYFESLKVQWIIPNPSPSEATKDRPDIITMTGIMSHRLVRID